MSEVIPLTTEAFHKVSSHGAPILRRMVGVQPAHVLKGALQQVEA